jgi:tetratricopeptide (TPR) repeat protein
MGKASKKKRFSSERRYEPEKVSLPGSGLLGKPIVHIIFLSVICLLAYSNTFKVPFQFDDKESIVENHTIKDLGALIKPSAVKNIRYIGVLTFALNYKVNGLDVTGYHIVNLFIHIINALIVYWLIVLTFSTPFLEKSELKDSSNLLALFTALFFACHPVQTQAVTYIVQRFASLATMFYLFSIVMYVKARLDQTTFSASTLTFYFLSLVSAILAMKTKEIAFTLPVVIAVYEFVFFSGKTRRRLLYLIPFFLTMLIIPLSLIKVVKATGVLTGGKSLGDLIGDVNMETRMLTEMPRLNYLFTECRVIVTYLRLIFFPVNQNLDYDYPVYRSFLDPGVFLSAFLLLLILSTGVYLIYRYRNSFMPARLISFGIFWFFITLSVESSIIPIVDVIFEHRLYLPSVGAFMAISTSVFAIVKKRSRRQVLNKALIGVLTIIIVLLSGATYARNRVWLSNVGLWEDVVKKSPLKPRPYYNLGVVYQDMDLFDSAVECYKTVIKMSPEYAKAHNNLAVIYASKGLHEKAIEQFKTTIRLKPDHVGAHYNLGLEYLSIGRYEKAIEYFETAIKLKPDYVEAHTNLGIAYKKKGQFEKAIEHYTEALRLRPDSIEAHHNLGNAYMLKGLTDKAIEQFEAALKINPSLAETHYNLGVIYYKTRNLHRAQEELRTALRIKPDYHPARELLSKIE